MMTKYSGRDVVGFVLLTAWWTIFTLGGGIGGGMLAFIVWGMI